MVCNEKSLSGEAMLSRVTSCAVIGLDATPVEVETETARVFQADHRRSAGRGGPGVA